MPSKPKFYAVAIGARPGIYHTWDDCQRQVIGYSGAVYKAFSTETEAKTYIEQNKNGKAESKPKNIQSYFGGPQNQTTHNPPKHVPMGTHASPIDMDLTKDQDEFLDSPVFSNYKSTSSTPISSTKRKAPPSSSQDPPTTSTSSTSNINSNSNLGSYTSTTSSSIPAPNNIPAGEDFISIELPLGKEQQHVLDLILQGKNVFFTGSAGTGKSFLLERIKRKLLEQGRLVAITAATGIAAVSILSCTLLDIGGSTLHKWSGIGLGVQEGLTGEERQKAFDSVAAKAWAKKDAWRNNHVLVIDEVSMISPDLLDDLDRIARAIRGVAAPFGGLQMILSGDFYQLPPISKMKNNKMAFDAAVWQQCDFAHIQLKQIYRQADEEFASLLNSIRRGETTPTIISRLKVCERDLPIEDGIYPTKLFALNKNVDDLNAKELEGIKSPAMEYNANDVLTNAIFPGRPLTPAQEKFAKTIYESFMAGEKLQLKLGAQVMLIKNVNEDLVNGSRGVVVGFEMYELKVDKQRYFENCAHVQLWADIHSTNQPSGPPAKRRREKNSEKDGNVVMVKLPVVKFQHGGTRVVKPMVFSAETAEHTAVRVQLPLKLAWALTIHKCQGLTLDKVEIDFEGIFECGQAYVALSRARTNEGLKIINFGPSTIRTHPKVSQFYREKFS